MAKRRDSEQQKAFIEWLNASVEIFPIAADYHVVPHGDNARDTQVYCPFHANVDTPSARMYVESNNLHCYSCGRDYGVYDFLTTLGGLSYADVMQTYGKAYDGHFQEHLASHRLENQKNVLELAAEDPHQKQTLKVFQQDLATRVLNGQAYRAWRAGGPFAAAAAEMDEVLTNQFVGYDYGEILRGT